MFFPWLDVTVSTVTEILWHLEQHPRPTPTFKPSDSQKPSLPLKPSKPEPQTKPLLPSKPISDQQKPNVTSPPKPITFEIPPSRLYALVIGINNYARVKTMRGAVADADAVVEFLKTSLGVPENRIKNLRDRQATRLNIRNGIRDLATCDDIAKDDPILIYYAGHGAEAKAPKGWPVDGDRIQMLVPYDFIPQTSSSESGQGLLDITLSILLNQLAKAKGNNITVILDSCHSASGTRSDSEHTRVISRGIDLPNDYDILPTLDQDIVPASRSDSVVPGFEASGLASHVLLAGCRLKQTSKEEDGRGRFTKALLKVLEIEGMDKMTYEQLIDRLDVLPAQNPQCEGIHKSRILFDAKASPLRLVLHVVTEKGDGKYELDAGEAYGITVGAKFNVYVIKNPNSQCLGNLVVTSTTAFTSDLALSSNSSPFSLNNRPGYALQTYVGEKQDLQLSIADDDRLLEVYERVKAEMDTNQLLGKRGIKLVEKNEYPDIMLVVEDGGVQFKITNEICVTHGLTSIPYTVPLNARYVFPVIASAADFYYHLYRQASDSRLATVDIDDPHGQALVSLECTELEYSDELDDEDQPLLKKKGPDLIDQGSIDIVSSATKMYGYRIKSNSKLGFYAALFYFSMTDLSITSYYQPNKAKGLGLEPCVPAGGSLTIGYGSGGHVPRSYTINDDKPDIDIGFVKLFVATQPVDFSHIAQLSPFSARRGGVPELDRSLLLWDSLTVSVIQRTAAK